MTTALAAPAQRAGLVTAVFVVGYLAFSVPALIAGVAATAFGLRSTALVYSASLGALVAVAAGILIFRPGPPTQPASQPKPRMPTVKSAGQLPAVRRVAVQRFRTGADDRCGLIVTVSSRPCLEDP